MAQTPKETLERELKLSFNRDFRFPLLPGEAIPPRVFTSTYCDTNDYRLARGGITLRRRVEKGKGLWQLKLPEHAARLELEMTGGPSGPPHALSDLLFARLRGRPIQPIARLRTRRSGIRVLNGQGPVADIVKDSVAVLNGRRVLRRFSELEVELVDGDQDVLKTLEATLRSAGAYDGDQRPKVFQALNLDFSTSNHVPTPEAPAIDHLKAMLGKQIEDMLAHDPGTRLGKDPEELHQMRVAIRRIRALLRAARPMLVLEWAEDLRSELAWLGGVVGLVRDHDVLLERFRAEADVLDPSERRAFEGILLIFEEEHSKSRIQMIDALRSERYLQLLNRLDQAVNKPETVSTNVSLLEIAAREFNTLRRTVRDLGPDPTDEALHKTRITLKHARYAAELAERVIGKPALRFIRQTKQLQDLLGEHQDAVVAENRLRELLHRGEGTQSALAVGRIIERMRSSRATARSTFPKAWAKVKKRGREAWRAQAA